ncbi:hypothetical protein SAMN05421594_3176 [Chryseobacterium oleae]|uniref:Uncharacterized protein n=1 Tax=Chryseobacterium oleae TaxID=491207 RepID=A0A1I4ZR65_CHROL|nr:hypothetical protein [Chryseobacterium oleae]SFN52775.1 hypothetical protein SAMN05421594_3176 [Chryseobacterium oleae]
MAKTSIDYSQIELQEHIPLTEEEISSIANQKQDFFKHVPGVLILVILLMVLMACYLLKDKFHDFKYYHYLLFSGITLVLYAFLYGIMYLVYIYFVKNWEKDIKSGKNRLISVIISRHKTENDEYIITFSGRSRKEKIRLPVSKADYLDYLVGTQVVVVYLKHSKTVISIDHYNHSTH